MTDTAPSDRRASVPIPAVPNPPDPSRRVVRSGRVARRTALGTVALLLAATAPAVAQEGTLVLPQATDIGSLDPDNAFEVDGLGVVNALYEGLVEYAPGSTELVGLLAEGWTVSGDGLTYTFDLRDGVTFHDGASMDAQAVQRALERRRDGDLVLSYFLGNVAGMETPDADTLVVTLSNPQPSFLDALASPWGPKVVAPSALEAEAETPGTLNETAVGTGPFRLARFDRGTGYELERFDGYWGEAPHFERVRIDILPDMSQQILRLRTGDIDAVPRGYPWAQLRAVAGDAAITAADSMALVIAFVKPGSPLDDETVRGAILTALDPAGWSQDAFGDYAGAARSLYPRAMIDPDEPIAFPSDMDAARATIEAAGDVTLTIGYPTADAGTLSRVADLLVAQLSAIGVQATATAVPTGAEFNFQSDMNAAPDLLLARNSPDAAHPDTQAPVFYATGGPINVMGVSNAEADAIATEAAALTDREARDAAYLEAGRLWFDAGQFIPLVDLQDVVVHRDGLTDLGLRPVFPPGNIDLGTVRYGD